MNETDIVGMLKFMQPHEPYLAIDDITINSWYTVLTASAPNLDVQWTKAFITRFYAQNDGGLTTSKIINAWRTHTARAVNEQLSRQLGTVFDAHCGRPTCQCTHTGPCFKGWIDSETSTQPCYTCRPKLAEIIAEIPEPGKRSSADQARISERAKIGRPA